MFRRRVPRWLTPRGGSVTDSVAGDAGRLICRFIDWQVVLLLVVVVIMVVLFLSFANRNMRVKNFFRSAYTDFCQYSVAADQAHVPHVTLVTHLDHKNMWPVSSLAFWGLLSFRWYIICPLEVPYISELFGNLPVYCDASHSKKHNYFPWLLLSTWGKLRMWRSFRSGFDLGCRQAK